MKHHAHHGFLAAATGLAIFLSLAIDTPSYAQSLEFWNTNCRKLYKQAQSKPKHWAFAVTSTAGDGSSQACGAAWAESSKKAAERSAIAECKKQRSGACYVTKSE
jgi:hypothetical protein